VSKKAKAAIVIGCVVIIALLVTVIVLLTQGKEDAKAGQGPEQEKRATVVTKDNAEQVVEEMGNQEYIQPGYYNAQMTNEWHFANGSATSEDAYVANDKGNTNDVFFDIVLAEDESKVIYKSPVIPRGGELDGIKLDEVLSAGTYDCVMIYHLVDSEQNTISTVRVGITIIVES
jgi:hypothetical protein